MILFSILFFMAVYAAISIGFLVFVRSRTERPLYALLAVILIILVPTWDVLLGLVVYFPARVLVPRATIHETARANSLYFEGMNDCLVKYERRGRDVTEAELTRIGDTDGPLKRGFSFVEARVTRERKAGLLTRERIRPSVYKCVAAPWHEDYPDYFWTSCSTVNELQSRYMVKERTLKMGTTEIKWKSIIDLSTKKLLGKSGCVCIETFVFPFFNWLDWDWDKEARCSPPARQYNGFQYEVIRPENPKDPTLPAKQWWEQ